MWKNQDSRRLSLPAGALAISLCALIPRVMAAQSPADAQALEHKQDWKGAEAIWRKLATASPGDYRLWTSLGIVLAREQRYEDAASAYHKALALKPRDAQIELNLAIAYFKAGKLPQALEPLRIAAQQQPANPQIETLLGMTLFGTSRYKEAIPYLEKTLERQGENPSLEQALAQSYLQAGEYQKALAEFRHMLERDPDSAPVHMLLGEAYDAQGEPDKAIAEFQAATEKGYTPDAHFGLGFLLWKAHRYDEAKAQFEKELQNDPQPLASADISGGHRSQTERPQVGRSLARQSDCFEAESRVSRISISASPRRSRGITQQLSAI